MILLVIRWNLCYGNKFKIQKKNNPNKNKFEKNDLTGKKQSLELLPPSPLPL